MPIRTDLRYFVYMKRRTFLKTSIAIPIPFIVPASARGAGKRPAPSERLTVGLIGCGNNGLNWMRNFMGDERVQIVAACDVNQRSNGYWANREGGRDVAGERAEQKYGQGIALFNDFRELLARDDIDAVQIATPDHWHALQVIAAARAGKHIYGQKPLSLTVREGRLMSDAVAKAGVTFQTGSQQRSSAHFHKANELVRNGLIGNVRTVRVGLPGGHPDYSKRGASKDEQPVPRGLDYDLWLGPAPEAYYCDARLHVNWRWILDYSGGQVTDWGAHHIDCAQWILNRTKTGPVVFRNLAGDFPPRKELYNTARSYSWECEYKDGVKMLVGSNQPGGVKLEGEDGKWIHVNRGMLKSHPPELVKTKITDGFQRVERSVEHVRNFVDAVYSGKEPIAPIEDAHRSISIAHLGNIALQLKRETLEWDPDNERILGDEAAGKMLTRPYRDPWKLPA